jgi:S-adenosylmethionine synthetase
MLHVIAKNLVAAGVADEILVQVSYAIGVANQWVYSLILTERQN